MKCDNCGKHYRGQKGVTIKDMNRGRITHHFCGMECLMDYCSQKTLEVG